MNYFVRFARRTGAPKAPSRFILLASFLFLGIFSVSGQSSGAPRTETSMRLSPDEAVEMAVRNNLSLESARANLDIKKRKSDLVWNQFLPTLSANGTLMRDNYGSTTTVTTAIPGTGTPLTVEGISGRFNPDFFVSDPIDVPRWHINGSFSASLTFSFALIAGIQSIKADYAAGLVGLEKARLQLERDVRKSYNQILLLEANAALLNDSYLNAERQAAMAEANYRAGLAPRLTWLQAQVQVQNLKPSISEMENNLKALKANFAFSLGLPYDTAFALEPLGERDFQVPPDTAELISRAASGKPDILELQSSIAMLQKARAAQALQLYTPYLNFSWGINSTFIRDPWKDSWFDTDNWKGGGNFAVTLGLSLNSLFPFTKEGQGLKDVDTNLLSMNINLAQMIRGTELEIFSKINSLEKIRTSAEVHNSAVELAEQSYRLTEEAYRAGLQDFQSVQSSALALDQAKLQLFTQRFNYLNDLIDLEYSVGVPFGTFSKGSVE